MLKEAENPEKTPDKPLNMPYSKCPQIQAPVRTGTLTPALVTGLLLGNRPCWLLRHASQSLCQYSLLSLAASCVAHVEEWWSTITRIKGSNPIKSTYLSFLLSFFLPFFIRFKALVSWDYNSNVLDVTSQPNLFIHSSHLWKFVKAVSFVLKPEDLQRARSISLPSCTIPMHFRGPRIGLSNENLQQLSTKRNLTTLFLSTSVQTYLPTFEQSTTTLFIVFM